MATSAALGHADKRFIGPEPTWLVFDVTTSLTADATETVTLKELGEGVRILDGFLETTTAEAGATTCTMSVKVGATTVINGTSDNLASTARDAAVVADTTTGSSTTTLTANVARTGSASSTAGVAKIVLLVARASY